SVGDTAAGAAALWFLDDEGAWRLLGVLLEGPEAIDRPGRLEVQDLYLGDRELTATYWDGRRSRLVALTDPFEPDGPLTLAVAIRDRSPANPTQSTTLKVLASVDHEPPTLAGIL